MNDNFRGFGTESYTLLVGPDEEKLYVPRGLLSQIPYFDQAFTADGNVDSEKTQFKMPDFDPKALVDVVTSSGRRPYLNRMGIPRLEASQTSRSYGHAGESVYCSSKVGAKLDAEGIERQLVLYHQNHDVDPRNLILLHQADLRGSILYKFMMAELGYLFSKYNLETLESMVPGFTAVCETMPQEILWDFLEATDTGYDFGTKDRPSKQPYWLNDSITESADIEEKS